VTATAQRPPRDGLLRSRAPGLELRAATAADEMPTLFGYFLRFNEWTEIQSVYEGNFMECATNGAAARTLAEDGDAIRILFNHGFDPTIGEKPLTKPDLAEDTNGVRYEGRMFDTDYCRELVPALEAGVLGASLKFSVVQELWNEQPGASPHNPNGIPERTLQEIVIAEGGPVTFPAYTGATAGVRSTTDLAMVAGTPGFKSFEPGKRPGWYMS
jgi:HK97 family phage prohead protease